MEDKLVGGLQLSIHEGESGEDSPSHPQSHTYHFYDWFPYYLSIGMTYEQYWDGDPTLVIAYRKAEKLRSERRNFDAWLQGAYIYEVMCDVAPIYNPYAKKGTKPTPYAKKPYALDDESVEQETKTKEKNEYELGKAKMLAYMTSHNQKFKEGNIPCQP